jgi:surface polysaccharide O-acyltransferase-like enzyme
MLFFVLKKYNRYNRYSTYNCYIYMNKTNYNFSADLLRAIAIIFVVIVHVFSEFLNYHPAFLTSDWWFAAIINSLARMAVPLFVMLSGYLLLSEHKTHTTKDFLRKRFSKIGPPLLLWPFVYYAWKLFSAHASFSLATFMTAYISMTTYYHLYFLYLVAGLYLITPIIKPFFTHGSSENKKYVLVISFSFTILTAIVRYVFDLGLNFGTIFTIFLPYIAYFLAGHALRNSKLSRRYAVGAAAAFILCVALIAIGTQYHVNDQILRQRGEMIGRDYGGYFYDYMSIPIIGMSVIAFIMLMQHTADLRLEQHPRWRRIITQVATTSFGVFLVHPLILAIVNKYFLHGYSFWSMPIWIFLIYKTALIFAISYIVVTVAIRTPLRAFFI